MTSINRRSVIRGALTAATAAGIGPILSFEGHSQTKSVVNMQLGWLASGNQLGEVCAKALGYYEAEGIDLKVQPGGPNIDGVAIVAAGRYEIGQVSSSPSLMLAVSQDIPIKCFATGAQVHPYTFFSLKKNAVREPKDLIGKKVGIQSTGVILLRALLAKNKIADKDVTIIPIGAEMSPLLTGQVDVVTGWLTNTTALKVLGDQRVDMRLWDSGVRLYALPYYATVDTLTKKPEMLAKFVRATSKGWAFARGEPDKAVDLLVKEYPNLVRADEIEAARVMLQYAFSDTTKTEGWGAMDPAVWQEQISLYADLGQFTKRVPKVEEVMTLDILNMTADTRAKLG
jgi:NitT/TauT family transport system substrate-binding protein